MAFTVDLNWHDRHTRIRSLDVMQFDDAGLITEMKAYYGPSDITTEAEPGQDLHCRVGT